MITSLFVSTFLVCAVPPPPAFERPTYPIAIKVIRMILDVAWDKPNHKPVENPKVLIIGDDQDTLRAFRDDGWQAWTMMVTQMVRTKADFIGHTRKGQFPVKRHVLDVVLYELMLPFDTFSLREVIVDVGRAIKVGGYFIVPNGEEGPNMGIFRAHNFFKVPFTFKFQGQWFAIYQKQVRRSA